MMERPRLRGPTGFVPPSARTAMPNRRCAIVALALSLTAAAAEAQAEIAVSVGFNSQYQWRGLTTTNRGVVQPDLAVSFPSGQGSLTFGAWANLEGGRYDDVRRHISESGGQRPGLAEYDLRIEGARHFGRVGITIGASTYSYPNRLGTTGASNTAEAYARVALDAPLAPSVALWQDVQKVRGAYAEFGVTQEIGPIALAAIGGWNLGQSLGDGGALGYFARHGLTHVDMSASAEWSVGTVSMAPAVHVLFGSDPNTFVASPNASRGAKLWFGTSIGWSGRAASRVQRIAEATEEEAQEKR